ncbi:MAG: ATP-dependent DNA helicase RecG [Acidobacteriota bacterium]|nr:MAG: ATP-dependent DNA helicase RecG [Acidobacteriota bacterium]
MKKPPGLDTPVQYVKGVGPRRAQEFAEAGVHTVEDLLCRLPFRYEDRTHFRPLASVRPGEAVTVAGEVVECGVRRTRLRRMENCELVLDDGTATLGAIWFNQPFLRKLFKRGQRVILYGVVKLRAFRGRPSVLQMEGPDFEIAGDERDAVHMGAIVPVYERLGSVSPKAVRVLMHGLLEKIPPEIPEVLPPSIVREAGLMPRREAFHEAHFPKSFRDLAALNDFASPAHRRLIFEDLFALQCGLLLRKGKAEESPGIAFKTSDEIREILKKILPFHLTGAQRRALKEIVDDMTVPRPMHRLLQGDVGCGKTIVALLAMLIAVENGRQAAFMVPTEILAEQHYFNIRELLKGTRYRAVLLTGPRKGKAKKTALQAIAAGDAHIVLGTHAVIEKQVQFHRLGFVVIDEQHRFGVLQRARLIEKSRLSDSSDKSGISSASRQDEGLPDVLVMTATPIPRSLALTLYGDLNVSVIDEMPPGRTPVVTRITDEAKRGQVYSFIRREVEEGGQAYVVYPLIEDSPKKTDLKAAVKMFEHLQKDVFPDLSIALLHGRVKSEEKDAIMQRFKEGGVHVLVSTTVIEVGVDVANASIMLIENAERFGLAQLHQLRGRVGRGRRKSYCILLASARLTEEARMRLGVMEETNDGFKISEKDLEIRGPGDFFGTAQSGMMPLRVANILRDRKLMEEARRTAASFLASLEGRSESERRAALFGVLERWKGQLELVTVG